jgi:hypothetical protein
LLITDLTTQNILLAFNFKGMTITELLSKYHPKAVQKHVATKPYVDHHIKANEPVRIYTSCPVEFKFSGDTMRLSEIQVKTADFDQGMMCGF